MKFISRLSVIAVIILSVTFLYACGKIDDSINDKGNKTESKIEIVDDSDVEKVKRSVQNDTSENVEILPEKVVNEYLQVLAENISSPEEFAKNTGKYIKTGSDAYRDMRKYVDSLKEFKISSFVIKSPEVSVMLHNILTENSEYSINECNNSDKKTIVTVTGTTPDLKNEKNRSDAVDRIIPLFMNYISVSGKGLNLFNADNDDKNKIINDFINENYNDIKTLFSDIAADSEKASFIKKITVEYDGKWLITDISDSYIR